MSGRLCPLHPALAPLVPPTGVVTMVMGVGDRAGPRTRGTGGRDGRVLGARRKGVCVCLSGQVCICLLFVCPRVRLCVHAHVQVCPSVLYASALTGVCVYMWMPVCAVIPHQAQPA